MVELLVEHVFDSNDLISETDEDDSGSEKTVISFTLFSSRYHLQLYPTFSEPLIIPSTDYCDHFKSLTKRIQSPPPKA